jgi:hypothetical protein
LWSRAIRVGRSGRCARPRYRHFFESLPKIRELLKRCLGEACGLAGSGGIEGGYARKRVALEQIAVLIHHFIHTSKDLAHVTAKVVELFSLLAR